MTPTYNANDNEQSHNIITYNIDIYFRVFRS